MRSVSFGKIFAKDSWSASSFAVRRNWGDYIVDFVWFDAKLIVEMDGGQHLVLVEYDATRTEYLSGLGYRLVRYRNHQVLNQIDDVVADIPSHLLSPHPGPPLQG